MIKCISDNGQEIMVPIEELSFRPSAYAVIIKDKKILLVSSGTYKKFFFPGGGVELGEPIETALKREVMEEAGTKIEIDHFITFKEKFIYYHDLNKACHNFSFFYLCRPLSLELKADNEIIDEDAKCVQWVDLAMLNNDNCGGSIIEVLSNLNLI